MSLPDAYAWLNSIGELPHTISEALKLLGTREKIGAENNPVIMGWADEIGQAAIGYKYTADSVPWCGLFAAVVVHRAGKTLPAGPLYALNWSKFGSPVMRPGLGDILTFQRPGGGHVGFYIGEDVDSFCVLGGNQGDAVSFTWIAKDRCHASRRPLYNVQPASVKPYQLIRAGALSQNEA